MTRRPWWRAALGVALAIALYTLLVWRMTRVDPLPPPVRHAVEDERLARARVDSQLVAATIEAEAAQRRQEEATQRAERSERARLIASHRADSLAKAAAQAQTARDSALYWHLAYAARTSERDTLLTVIAEQDTALLASNDRARAFQQAAYVANTARIRADSVLDAVVKSASVCTVPGTFGRLRCPSRKTALVVGIVGGVAAKLTYDAVRDGRIRLPLRPLHRLD